MPYWCIIKRVMTYTLSSEDWGFSYRCATGYYWCNGFMTCARFSLMMTVSGKLLALYSNLLEAIKPWEIGNGGLFFTSGLKSQAVSPCLLVMSGKVLTLPVRSAAYRRKLTFQYYTRCRYAAPQKDFKLYLITAFYNWNILFADIIELSNVLSVAFHEWILIYVKYCMPDSIFFLIFVKT